MEMHDVRNSLLKLLRADVMGPQLDSEERPIADESLQITGSPDRFYLVGKLLPVRRESGQGAAGSRGHDIIREDGHDADLSQSSGENKIEAGVSTSTSSFTEPSSMGITVCPINSDAVFDITVLYAMYHQDGETWRREPYEEIFTLNFGELMFGERRGPIMIGPHLSLYLRKGTIEHPTLTVRIKNEVIVPPGQRRGAYTVHQPEIRFGTDCSWRDVRKAQDDIRQDKTMQILYSDSVVYALGHNVGVNWNDKGEIWTDFLPEYTMNKMKEDESLRQLVPSMNDLCDESRFPEAIQSFHSFLDAYKKWIDSSRKVLQQKLDQGILEAGLTDQVNLLLSKAEENLRRMREGVEFLGSNDTARLAFILANRAIQKSQNESSHPDVAERTDFQWRPFQIAFQLVNIRGLCATEETDLGFEERNTIDLAWFPTGGGKTEAYLGMIATISFYRRLRYPEQEQAQSSVHAIMRYTLRLLTSDQADRLVRLVGAMNAVATDEDEHHNFKPFRVGMWIGSSASPNRLLTDDYAASAEENLDRMANDMPEKEGTVIQFEICPWCGSSDIAQHQNWSIGTLNNHPTLHGSCPDESCLFNEWIPFTCIDDDIYLNPPTVLLATADKFAQVARNPWARSIDSDQLSEVARTYNTRNLLGFGGVSRPPDLIIQDELHLLTGPLGTIAGLVETAIETAWDSVGHRPKYVAATATIRGAERDAMLMFGRRMNIFPPPVETAADNFFAKLDSNPNEGRTHIAIMGPPGASRTMFSQPTASFLQRLKQLRVENPHVPDTVFDPYFTLVAYFNSLRELGSAQTMLPDRVAREFIGGRYAALSGVEARTIPSIKELTSRKSSQELKQIKASLGRTLGEDPVDVVVTTNMFQVGIDIGRLGAMVIVGQPKSNSEYIQSSGRVGRRFPGVVISLLRSTYPRDQSHFENYRAFHQEVYGHVDLTSTTPFSQRALDRGMASSIAIMLRLKEPTLSQNIWLNHLHLSQDRKDAALRMIDLFKQKLEQRELDEDVQSPVEIVNEALNSVERKYQGLLNFLNACGRENLTPIWVEQRHEASNNQRGWLRTESSGESGAINVLQSFRDVAPEVRVVEDWRLLGSGGHEDGVFTMPAGHLMAQAAPGNIWEKDGQTYLTNGVQFWANGEHNLALQPVGQNGQVIERDAIYEILPRETKLRYLPTQQMHGAVSVTRYPMENGFRCTEGHLTHPRRPGTDGHFYCARADCQERASPTRFVSVCPNGHLHPFNYWGWVHNSPEKRTKCNRNAEINLNYGPDASHTLRDWVVECTGCGATRDMERVTSVTVEDGPNCRGHKPWLTRTSEGTDECDSRMVHRQVGSTNVSFNNGGSMLLIPLQVSWRYADVLKDVGLLRLANHEEQSKRFFTMFYEGMMNDTQREELVTRLESTPFVDRDRQLLLDDLFETCKEYNSYHGSGGVPLTLANIRKRERHGILNPEQASALDPEEFDARTIIGRDEEGFWREESCPVDMIVRVDRLTELRFMSGVSRLEASNPELPIDLRRGDKHGIARMHHGEGIYFDIKTEWLEAMANWRRSNLSTTHASMEPSMERLRHAFANQSPSIRGVEGSGNPLTVLHSLSHLLIRETCLIAGYSAGSISERLYIEVNDDGSVSYAGVLLYTSGPSSDGTLGGLVRQAAPDRLESIVRRAMLSLEDCSNDPVCLDHTPSSEERNGAACHACLYLPETSCELGNLFLDRRWTHEV